MKELLGTDLLENLSGAFYDTFFVEQRFGTVLTKRHLESDKTTFWDRYDETTVHIRCDETVFGTGIAKRPFRQV